MKLIEVVGGKRWANMFFCICLSWAHSSAAGLPTPKFRQEMRPNFQILHMCSHRLGLCVGKGVHFSSLTTCFSEVSFHPPHQFCPQGYHHNQKCKLSNSVLRSQNNAVAAKLCLERLIGHRNIRKGWPSGKDVQIITPLSDLHCSKRPKRHAKIEHNIWNWIPNVWRLNAR